MINKTCSIITDSNENYIGIVHKTDETFLHIQVQEIMFVIPIYRIKSISYGLSHKTDLSRKIEEPRNQQISQEMPDYNNPVIDSQAALFSNNTKQMGVPVLPLANYGIGNFQNMSEIKKFINSKLHNSNVNSQNKKSK